MTPFSVLLLVLFIAPVFSYSRRASRQRQYNDAVMKKNTININDRIYYNKIVTTPFLASICPVVSDLLVKYQTGFYEFENYNHTEFQDVMIRNVTDAFLSEVYTEKNYPTHRHDVVLQVTVDDIKRYNNYHCKTLYKTLLPEIKAKTQSLYEYRTQQSPVITIELRPNYYTRDYQFQKQLCPTIQHYKRINESYSTRENFVTALVRNITTEYMSRIYSLVNFPAVYRNNAILQTPTEDDINLYYQNHCTYIDAPNYYGAYVAALFSTVAVVSIL